LGSNSSFCLLVSGWLENAASCHPNSRPRRLEDQDARLRPARYSPIFFVAKIRGSPSHRKANPALGHFGGCELPRRPPRPLSLRIWNQTQHFPHGTRRDPLLARIIGSRRPPQHRSKLPQGRSRRTLRHPRHSNQACEILTKLAPLFPHLFSVF